MKFSFLNHRKSKENETSLSVLVASCMPDLHVLEALSDRNDVKLREAFTTQGVLQSFRGPT